MSELVVMPKADWQAALDATRAKTGKTDLIKSGDLAGEIESISAGGGEEEVNTLDAFIDGTLTELTSNVESVRNNAFYGAPMKTINLPNAKSLGQYSFYRAEAKTVNCTNVETIGTISFSYSKITSISMPKLKIVSQEAFSHAGYLVDVDLPLAEELKSNAFADSSKIAYLDFPCVKTIGSLAIAGCPLLSVVILRNTSQVCSLYNTSVFKNTPFASGKAGGKLLIPRALVDGYKNGTNWSAVLTQNTNNKYLALEDYTVDGTITGAIDWDKLNAA